MTLTSESSELLRVRAQAEAAAWMALLHSPERNADIEMALQRWIAAHPSHATAWEVATDVWNETAGLPRRIPLRKVVWYRSRSALLRPVLALGVLSLVVAGIALRHFLPAGVNTEIGEQKTLNLEDGTRVELNTDSHLLVRYDHATRTVVLESGEVYFQVAREHRPFVVIAGERKILALGTAFTVRRDESGDDSLTVTLLEGRVAVAPVAAASVASAAPASEVKMLNPGERLRGHRHAAPILDSPSLERATGWMRGQLIFDQTPLREAIAEFNRYSASKIIVASPETGAIPVGGIFRISDSKSFARAVAETYNLRLTQRGAELVLDSSGTGPPQSPLLPPDP